MKKLFLILTIAAIATVTHAQRHTFNLPAYFTTNVFLSDDTNTPLHTRIQGIEATNAPSAGVTNIGFGLTGDGQGVALAVDSNIVVNPSGWSGFPATGTVNMAGNNLDLPSGSIVGQGLSISFGADEVAIENTGESAGVFSGNWVFQSRPDLPGGYISTNGNAASLTNFPTSLLRVSAANSNYWRQTTAPTGATAFGSSGQMAVSGTNLFIYSPNALGVGTARWLRVNAEAAW